MPKERGFVTAIFLSGWLNSIGQCPQNECLIERKQNQVRIHVQERRLEHDYHYRLSL